MYKSNKQMGDQLLLVSSNFNSHVNYTYRLPVPNKEDRADNLVLISPCFFFLQ